MRAIPRAWLAAVVLTACPAAGPTSAAAATSCTATTGATCSGSILDYCDPSTETMLQQDCSQTGGSTAFTCQLVNPDYGSACVAPVSANCLGTDPTGRSFAAFCQGSDAGCVLGPSAGFCQEDIGQCLGATDGGFTFGDAGVNRTACLDNLLEVACNVTQPVVWNCESFGGSCGAVDGGAGCVGLPPGVECDKDGFTCITGSTCGSADGGGWFCGAIVPGDAG